MPHSEKIRIAIVDDDEDDYFILNDYISEIEGKKIVVDWYRDYATAIKKIQEKAYQLYFIDYRLGSQSGLELIQEACRLGCDEPLVLLTGKGNKTIDIRAMQNGATDYLVKSELNTEKLERCIRYSLDRARFLKELKAREYKYRNLFENSKDAVFIANRQLSFLEFNHTTSLLLGLKIEEIKEHNLFEYIKDEVQQRQIARSLEAGKNIKDLEIRLHQVDEETKICLLSLSIQENADEELLVHGIIHDITNIKKAELSNLQAEKLAANERLVRMLAHEIRNPLNNISLSTENLVAMNDGNEVQKSLLSILQRNSSRINQIITDLLNLTRAPELIFEKYSLQEIVDESLDIARDRIDLQKAEVEKKYPCYPLEIEADKSRLVIAISNILVNAVEAMEPGKGRLAVSLYSSEDGYNVSIRDNGSGISEEYISRLFDPFFTLKKNGMGLGLAVSYSIIQSHKGGIAIETALGKGTNFIVNFSKMHANGL